ncbi:TerC family protein [Bradyrhizobium australiense]|uniref:TerC family protein n=1 Tax=Bradyrhizobium australiense TaxID=2721161 RepID=A0A7Y4GZ01_9BRAD|nr:TerC family protein [Bradyrhizobium australiense]NOJ44254.1 TerC family protein [Bradyrhizobium australiense]
MLEFFSSQSLTALFQVVMIDLVLAGDNAIVIGLAAAGLPEDQRKKAILVGILAATALRIGFASITVQLLQIIGLLLAGGILLLWVCWKMWRELQSDKHHGPAFQNLSAARTMDATAAPIPQKTLGQAVWQITLADVSMSLDNVLAVAGAAREHPIILIFGLGLSIALMGFAASFIARVLEKHRWVAYVGLLIILYVAFDMCYRGAMEVWQDVKV